MSVVLPLALLRLLEQRTSAGHPLVQQAATEHAAPQLKEGAAVAWPMRAYLSSSLVWCAVGLGLHVWQAAAPGRLVSTLGG